MFLLSLFLLKKKCNIHFRIINRMGVHMGNSRVTTISDAHDLSVLLIYDHWKPCHNNHISWYLWETKPKISKVLYFTIKTIAINSVVRAEKPTALIKVGTDANQVAFVITKKQRTITIKKLLLSPDADVISNYPQTAVFSAFLTDRSLSCNGVWNLLG